VLIRDYTQQLDQHLQWLSECMRLILKSWISLVVVGASDF